MRKGVRDKMESASPTASASTNRGGRPKDWTEPRTRRLIRLYLYTTLPFPKILDLLEENEFKPGKDAANKVKNNVLGNDARWIRPKDDKEEGTRIRGLRNSLRGRRCPQNTPCHDENAAAARHHNAVGNFPEDGSLGGTTIAHSYRSSIEELSHLGPTQFDYLDTTTTDVYSTGPGDLSSRFIPSFISRLNTSRQDSGLTASTDISITSALREKLSSLSLNKAKRAVKVLKRYTFPKNLESQRGPDVPSGLFPSADLCSPPHGVDGSRPAAYALPGDFLNIELLTRQQQCTAESPAHAAGICWCKIASQISPMDSVWATFRGSFHVSDPTFTRKDRFGNTLFHFLATQEDFQDRFLYIAYQALRVPDLPIRDSNTAGQTFLHVLHRSWFQEGSRLEELLGMLQQENFDIFATDVYGRSYFHALRLHKRGSARFSGQPSDINRMNIRDAFGMKPMDSRSFTTNNSGFNNAPAHNSQTTQQTSTSSATAFVRPTPRINTQSGIVEDKEILAHTDLLKVITSAIGVDDESFPNTHIEDSQGRNGLHCLAEVNFSLSPSMPKRGSRAHLKDDTRSAPQEYNKRKHKDDDEIEKPTTAPDSMRPRYMQGLIRAGVDPDHYDKRGNTPLMSFVVNSSDATKYEKEESEVVIRALVEKTGAKLESRNRNGETALHLAARYGKTIALRVLLELGANPRTRNAQGLSILEVLDSLYVETERDDKNNARFEACRAILTRLPEYAVQSPTLIDEWGVK
ncbi:hypothetical protein F4802DRAFT_61316 [Xylaria palmicola]|nr:hypothetical protein F4802DRAFT_61316 [Xylaria palmicola]